LTFNGKVQKIIYNYKENFKYNCENNELIIIIKIYLMNGKAIFHIIERSPGNG